MTFNLFRCGIRNSHNLASSEHRRLIGVENIPTPVWASQSDVANASLTAILRSAPKAIAAVTVLSWRTSRWLTVLTGLVHLVSGVTLAFGLFATVSVFSELFDDGPTPQKIVDALPSILLVTVVYSAKALLAAAAFWIEGELRPQIMRAADDQVKSGMFSVDLISFEDADFRELARQGGQHGVAAFETSFRQTVALVSASVSTLSAVIAVAILSPLLIPALALSAGANGWAAARVAKLRYRHFLATVTRNLRRSVLDDVATDRHLAVERAAFNMGEILLREYRHNAHSLTRADVLVERKSSLVRLLGRSAAGVGTGLSYGVLILLLISGEVELALASTAVLAMRNVSGELASILGAMNGLYEASFYIEIYEKLLLEADSRQYPRSVLQAPIDPAAITLDDVSFTYPGQDDQALSDVSITIRHGEVVALVGENGSGKTTLAKVITGLFSPSAGKVYWDDVDVSEVDRHSVHDRVSIIGQRPAEWPMTLQNNIVAGQAADAELDANKWEYAVCHSGVEDILSDLPDGEHTLLSRRFSNGYDLSGGQWQRVGIARGMYRDRGILVADEPTASLDPIAESLVFKSLKKARVRGEGKRTTLLVTHRLSNVLDVDRIIVLQQGRVTEVGSHEELMMKRGHYHRLYEIQAHSYQDPLPADLM